MSLLSKTAALALFALAGCGQDAKTTAGKPALSPLPPETGHADLIQVDVGGGRGGSSNNGGLIYVDLGGGRWCRVNDWNCRRPY